MTLFRLKIAQSFCIKQFERFYGLRHVCITNIIAALSQTLKIHRSYRTTSIYVNTEDIKLIDDIFSLEIKDLPEIMA